MIIIVLIIIIAAACWCTSIIVIEYGYPILAIIFWGIGAIIPFTPIIYEALV